MHIRKAFVSASRLPARFTQTSWYLDILLPITEILKNRGIPCKITVHTDVNLSNIKWTPSGVSNESLSYLEENGSILDDASTISLDYEDFTITLGELGNIQVITEINPLGPSGILRESLAYSMTRGLVVNDDDTITLEYEDFLDSLGSLKNISVVTDINPVDAWKIMQEADLLVLAKSTFSVIPALMIKDGLVVSPTGFFRGPKNWIYLDNSEELSLEDIRKIIDK